MKVQLVSSNTVISTAKTWRNYSSQGASEIKELISKRKWMVHAPDTKIHQITPSPQVPFSFQINPNPELGNKFMDKDNQTASSFYVLRDDLLHPLVNGNKARKLDALLPLILDHSISDVVIQMLILLIISNLPLNSPVSRPPLGFLASIGTLSRSLVEAVKAHTLQPSVGRKSLPGFYLVYNFSASSKTPMDSVSVLDFSAAVSCAEAGIKSHLLLRGEQPEVLTGYNLISTLYGNVTYVPRHLYANRETMLKSHAHTLAGNTGLVVSCDDIIGVACTGVENYEKKVLIVNEGAGDTVALLGVIRLMQYLCQDNLLGKEKRVKLVVDSGTGTTAIGLGLGALCLGLPWEVTAITLADPIGSCIEREKHLISTFKKQFGCLSELDGGVVNWVERNPKRKFGKVLDGEIETCQIIARETGILVDPVYTLAAWELATRLSYEELKGGAAVVMLHTGGTLGMFGLAQRYKTHFNRLKDT